MKVGILGYGQEGKSAETYFTQKGDEVKVFNDFTQEQLHQFDLSSFDLILRSPSIHPQVDWSSVTKVFFNQCPCKIIGVTGTKGKGTTSSIIAALLQKLGQKAYLVGNIGKPAIDVLDKLQPSDAIVYEMSSFQLWDLDKSPQISVVLGIEPDHLNIHDSFEDYIQAKTNIAKHQTANDVCIYYSKNPDSTSIAKTSPGLKIPYPIQNRDNLDGILQHLAIPGQHNRDNAEAALLAVANWYQLQLSEFLQEYQDQIIEVLETFRGLPHRLQFLRELNGVKYYDDNFSTTPTSTAVALKAFPDNQLILIAGGRDKTNNQDLPEIAKMINNAPNISRTILIGESGRELIGMLNHAQLAESLESAVQLARTVAETLDNSIVLMSPAAASFDMFENVYARGATFQKLIRELK